MSKSLLLMLCILIGLLVLACGKSEETNRSLTGNANNANAPAPAATTTNRNDSGTSSATAQVGVAECDSFINAYENCVTTKVPEANRAQFTSSVNTWRTEWKKLADNPQTRGQLPAVCKTHLDNARAQMRAYGCTF